MPIFFSARSYLPPTSVPKIKSESGRAMQPTVALDFAFELARRPAGITEREYCACRTIAARNRLENVERCSQANAVVDRQRRILDEKVGAVQHKAALGLNRTTAHDFHDAGARRQPDHIRGRDDIKFHQQIREVDIRRRMIDDDAHRTFGRMCADINERTGKSIVQHRRHGDQHLAVQIAPAPTSILDGRAARQFHTQRLAHRFAFANEWPRQKFTQSCRSSGPRRDSQA